MKLTDRFALGFGLTMGSEVYQRVTGKTIDLGGDAYNCANLRVDAPWYQATIPPEWCT